MTLTTNASSATTHSDDPAIDEPVSIASAAARGSIVVTAVLVGHDGQTWLPRTLAALAAQTRLPDRVLAADTGSRDDTPGLLRRAAHGGPVVTLGRTAGFGDAVRAALAAAEPVPPGHPGAAEWLWLLHDDCAPEPEALGRLVDAVLRSPSIGVAGPKLVAWDDPDRLLEVGLTASRGGRRVTEVEPGERDQGQKDHRGDVLAVGTAGMLVRRDVWDLLGGLDPSLPLFRDDIDLGWRAQLAGHRVVVVPGARVADAQASSRGLRPVDAVTGVPRRVDRSNGLRVALTGAPALAMPFLVLWFAAGGLLRALGLLIAKSPRAALDEVVAVGSVVLTPWRVLSSRWRARGTRRVPRRDIARLLAPRRTALRGVAESFAGSMGRAGRVEVLGGPSVETGPAAEETENVSRVTSRMTRRILTHPGLLVVLAASAVAGAVARSLIGPGSLSGGQLLPWSGSPVQAWHSYADAWHGSGLGTDAAVAPSRAVLAGLTWLLQPLSSQPSVLAVDVLLIGAIPLSALTAYVAAGTVLRSRWIRAWAALTWATLPTVTGALVTGRIGASVLHILLPLVVLGFARTLRRPGSSTAAFAGGLVLAVAASFVPAILAVAAAAALLGLVVGGWARRARSLLLLAVPAILLAPWLPDLVRNPRLLAAGPGLLTPAGGTARPIELLLLHPGGAGATPALLAAPLLLVGVAGLLRKGGSALLASCGLLALAGLALALGLPRVVVATGTAASAAAGLGGELAGWSGTGLDLLAVAAMVSALHGADGIGGRLSRHRFGWRQLVLAPLAVAAVLATVATALLLAWHRPTGPVQRSQALALPAVTVDQASGPMATRTLVLTADGASVGYRLVGAELGDPALTLPLPTGSPLVVAATQTLLSGSTDVTTDAVARELTGLGIGFVVVARPVPDSIEQRLDTTAGLTRLGESSAGALWRVEAQLPTSPQAHPAPGTTALQAQPPARVRLQDSAGRLIQDLPVAGPNARVATTLPPGLGGRMLVLAEPASSQWRASLAGVALTPAVSGGLQAFALPATGGLLRVAAVDDSHRLRQVQELGLVVVLLLALPLGRRRTVGHVLEPLPPPVADEVEAEREPEPEAQPEAQDAEL